MCSTWDVARPPPPLYTTFCSTLGRLSLESTEIVRKSGWSHICLNHSEVDSSSFRKMSAVSRSKSSRLMLRDVAIHRVERTKVVARITFPVLHVLVLFHRALPRRLHQVDQLSLRSRAFRPSPRVVRESLRSRNLLVQLRLHLRDLLIQLRLHLLTSCTTRLIDRNVCRCLPQSTRRTT